MNDRDLTVYRTTNTDAVAAWHAGISARKAWTEQMKAFLDEHGFDKRRVYISNSGYVLGVERIDDEEPPEGWRVDSRTGQLRPRLAKRAGKQIDARLADLIQPDPRDAMPGMPKTCFAARAMPMCGLELIDGALYATWPVPIPEKQVDLAIWERVKLSEYYRVLEEQQEREQVEAVTSP